jgi:hypothetical protein
LTPALLELILFIIPLTVSSDENVKLAPLIVNEYVQYYSGSGMYSATQSAIDLTKINGVALATDQLARVLLPLVSTKAAAIASARDTSQSYDDEYYKDLLDFSGRISSLLRDANVTAAHTALQQAMSAAIIAEGHTGPDVAGSHGLSIYIPEPGYYLTTYGDLQFAHASHWDGFLYSMTR